MPKEQEQWFDKLHYKRHNTATTLMDDFAISNIWISVVEKYRDQAHFIYELLQNANDAKATKSAFQLTTDGLYFKHNGTKNFWVSNPDNEKQDQQDNKLGDINAITAVAQSNKKDESTIGKFGVGFKAVFQYTNTPHIYEPNFLFKISNYIVPEKLEQDIPNRKKNETIFYFPFDKQTADANGVVTMSAEIAYFDILGKLKRLVYPTLFLSKLETVSWEANNEHGTYTKEIIESANKDGITYQKITLNNSEKIWLFSGTIENSDLTYSIGYFLDKKNKLIPKQFSAFCFFPTKETTNLNFILHAPFLLTDNREGIHRSKEHNTKMVMLLSQLAADSLLILKDLKLIDDDIVKIIPYKEPDNDDFFASFYETIKEKFEAEKLLPTKNEYAERVNAYWSSVQKLNQLFSDEQLGQIAENDNAKWVFTSKGRVEVNRGNKELTDYIDSITTLWIEEKDLLEGWSYNNGEKHNGITENFIENQNEKWLIDFYKWLTETDNRITIAKEKPFFLNKDGYAVPIYKNGKLNLYFPDNDCEGYETLNEELFKLGSKQLFKKFGIREYTVSDEIETAIIKFKTNQLTAESFFAKAFKYFKNECPQDEIDDFISEIEVLDFIPFYTLDKNYGNSRGSVLYYPSEKLIAFYEQKSDTQFVDITSLHQKYPNENDKKTLDSFLKKLKVNDNKPTIKDNVYNIVIPKLEEKGGDIEIAPLFKILLQYFKECKYEDLDNYIDKIKDLKFIKYNCHNNTLEFACAKDIYFPNEDLIQYFETKSCTKFVDLEDYYTFITEEKEQIILKEFLLKLGINENPKVIQKRITLNDVINIPDLDNSGRNQVINTAYKVLDGCSEILDDIDEEKSKLLWNFLCYWDYDLDYIYSEINYNYWNNIENFELTRLKNENWILTRDNEFVAPHQITINDLSEDYTKNYKLEELLGFQESVYLTVQEKFELYIEDKYDGDEEAFEEDFEEFKEWKEQQNNPIQQPENELQNQPIKAKQGIEWLKTIVENSDFDNEEVDDENNDDNLVNVKQHKRSKPNQGSSSFTIDYDKEFAKAAEIVTKKLETQDKRTELIAKIKENTKYSYDWFKNYLELLTTYRDKKDTSKQKSISFQEIKPQTTDNKYFILCDTDSYISPEIENAEDFKINLVFGSGKKEIITIEGVSKKGQDLLIYIREGMSEHLLSRLQNVFKIEIKFTPVIDLLDRLHNAFINIKNIEEWEDIEEAMPSLNYIYGPPGTGKTTTLCNNINEILASKPNAKFLVLTPTNKASDVVCKKLWEINSDIFAVRLSHPTDVELEEEAIYRDTLTKEDLKDINIVASTIHRLPYFDITEIGLLFQYKWDYVIFDEASMTGLHYITFAIMALFKTNPNTNFIIAGDPKQIPPVIEINDKELEKFDFQDENIYKMMNLESFNPEEQIIREHDDIINLETQYRSIPQIGKLFSKLSYSNLLKHHRKEEEVSKVLPYKIQNLLSSKITFVDIPLNEDNSIYKVSKLLYSSYQMYCTILVAEIIKLFDQENTSENWTIGLIAPYKAQAILLNKLITSYRISEKVKVLSDTVHGFQGDECDIVFFVCNPNNYKYTGHQKSLLSKEYIYNVAISRAKDYLIILHPYTTINNNPYINKIGKSHNQNFTTLSSKEIEKMLFNEENHIENNSYVSGHDNVNVFGLSEMKYFIKANDTAVDIQLRDIKAHKTNGSTTENTFTESEVVNRNNRLKIIGKIDLTEFEKYRKY